MGTFGPAGEVISGVLSLFGKQSSKKKKCKKNVSDLTFDALPDFPKQADKFQVEEHHNENDSFNNLNVNKTTTQCPENNKKESKEKVDGKEEKCDSSQRDNERKENGFQTNSKENSPILSQTSVVVNGGVGIHFGNVFNNVNNLYYNGSSTTSSENINRVKKTDAINDLLKCDDKIEAGHLQLLSSHFGDKWQQIGVTLGLTVGELHCVRKQKKELQERGFQMLVLWSQKRGTDARIGELCTFLWKGKVDTAREAVRQLSLNIDLFQ